MYEAFSGDQQKFEIKQGWGYYVTNNIMRFTIYVIKYYVHVRYTQ